jgi:curved DNA-binding protein CbpA
MSYYDVLGVLPDASQSEIEAAFQKLTKAYNSGEGPDAALATKSAKAVAEAYRALRDPERRKAYDTVLERQRAPAESEAIGDEEFRDLRPK